MTVARRLPSMWNGGIVVKKRRTQWLLAILVVACMVAVTACTTSKNSKGAHEEGTHEATCEYLGNITVAVTLVSRDCVIFYDKAILGEVTVRPDWIEIQDDPGRPRALVVFVVQPTSNTYYDREYLVVLTDVSTRASTAPKVVSWPRATRIDYDRGVIRHEITRDSALYRKYMGTWYYGKGETMEQAFSQTPQPPSVLVQVAIYSEDAWAESGD